MTMNANVKAASGTTLWPLLVVASPIKAFFVACRMHLHAAADDLRRQNHAIKISTRGWSFLSAGHGVKRKSGRLRKELYIRLRGVGRKERG